MDRISLYHQEGALRSYFPDSETLRRGETKLVWSHTISPTPLSDSYKVMLHYCKREGARVFVLEPNRLKLAEGKKWLPHVWSTPMQELCLFYPDGREFHAGMWFVKSIIPWTSEWLYHYEVWLGSGKWHGGGIEHETAAELGKRTRLDVKKLLM